MYLDTAERPHAPSGFTACMSAHSKTPYITPSKDFFSDEGQQLEFALVEERAAQGTHKGPLIAVTTCDTRDH